MSAHREARIAQLRADYDRLHGIALQRIRAAERRGGHVYLDDLQRRENEIADELHTLGARLGG
jgi:hypothetical protein